MFLETLLETGAERLQYTKSITTSMQNHSLGTPSAPQDDDEDDGLDLDGNEDWEDQ